MLHRIVDSPVGAITLVTEGDALVAVYLAGQKYEAEAELGGRDDSVAEAAASQLAEYFDGTRTRFELELAPRGTEFQRRVWTALTEIPYGQTETYGHLAERIGSPRGTRAVGAATGRNPLSIVVPCHRLVGADGQLTGYAGGLERKRWLLDFEQGALL